MGNKEVYFDNAASSMPSERVMKAAVDSMNIYGNPSSLHMLGIEAEKSINRARKIVADTINASPQEIIFTSSGTEANNLAVMGTAEAHKKRGNKIITTDSEHPSVFKVMEKLSLSGYEIVYLPTAGAKVDFNVLEKELDESVILISIMRVNNETGALYDIEKVRTIINKSGLYNEKTRPYIHCDAVQAYMKTEIDTEKYGADLISLSAHKIHGLKGTGALYVRKGVRISPIMLGGGQELGMRSSTENVMGIVAFGEAAAESAAQFEQDKNHVSTLYDYMISQLKRHVPEVKIIEPEQRIKNIISLILPSVRSEIMLNYLSNEKIYISSGSACSKRSHAKESGRVLKAFGLDKYEADFTVRISFSRYNSSEDIDGFILCLSKAIGTLAVK